MFRQSSLLLCLSVLVGCEEEKKPEAATDPSAAQTETAAATPGEKAPPAPEAKKKRSTGVSCLAGRWRYDYSDNALEAMIATLEGGKVTKEEGSLICSIEGDAAGTMTCEPEGGKPIINEVEATQGGMPFKLHMEISGTGKSKYQVKDEGTLHISGSVSELEMKAEVTLGGSKIPFPAKDFLSLFGSEGAVDAQFQCSGDELKMLHQVEGVATDWQTLKRVK